MEVDTFCHHLCHPFTAPTIQLKRWEKWAAAASAALAIFGLLPGLAAFYRLSLLF